MIVQSAQRANHGFALVDILVALAVMGMAGSILVGLIAFIERNANRTHELAQMSQGVASVNRILRQLTEDSYSARVSGAGAMSPHGTERAFVIASTGPRILGLSRPARFQLECEVEGEKTRIVLRWKNSDTGQEHAEIVGAALDYASFSYFGRIGISPQRSWQPAWQDNFNRLEAVKLTLHSREMPAPVEMTFPLRANMAVQCIRNPHQLGCHVRED